MKDQLKILRSCDLEKLIVLIGMSRWFADLSLVPLQLVIDREGPVINYSGMLLALAVLS